MFGALGAGLKGLASGASGFSFGVGAKALPGFIKSNPQLALPGMFLGGEFVKDAVYDPIAGSLTANSAENMQAYGAMNAEYSYLQQQQQQRMAGLQKDVARNAAALAATAPHLYNQILAGRTLPQGAVVLGGSPRTDLMEQLALGMASGDFNQPDSDTSMLAAMASGQF